jgi:hypothetical protein
MKESGPNNDIPRDKREKSSQTNPSPHERFDVSSGPVSRTSRTQ